MILTARKLLRFENPRFAIMTACAFAGIQFRYVVLEVTIRSVFGDKRSATMTFVRVPLCSGSYYLNLALGNGVVSRLFRNLRRNLGESLLAAGMYATDCVNQIPSAPVSRVARVMHLP